MKISTNTIGNYSPSMVAKTGSPAVKQEAVANETVKNENSPLTSKEKQFFAKMYPDKQSEIMDYHFYQRTGKMSGVSLGTIIDRRG